MGLPYAVLEERVIKNWHQSCIGGPVDPYIDSVFKKSYFASRDQNSIVTTEHVKHLQQLAPWAAESRGSTPRALVANWVQVPSCILTPDLSQAKPILPSGEVIDCPCPIAKDAHAKIWKNVQQTHTFRRAGDETTITAILYSAVANNPEMMDYMCVATRKRILMLSHMITKNRIHVDVPEIIVVKWKTVSSWNCKAFRG